MERMITVRIFDSSWAAQLARARLEAAGIESLIADEHFARMITITTAGGVRLQVRGEDAAAAAELLSREAALPEIYLVTEEDAASPRCPGCKSERISFERWSRIGFVSSWILLGLPIPIPRHRWLCRSCGAAWKEEDIAARRERASEPPDPEMPEDAMEMPEGAMPPETTSELGRAAAGDQDDPLDLVAVAQFTAPWEAHLARTRLEVEGIAACVLEERLPLAGFFSGQPVALSRVAVRAEDAGRAREVLAVEPPAALHAAAEADD